MLQKLTNLRTYQLTLIIFFWIAFVSALTSCEIQRDCPGAGRQNGYSGYGAGGYHGNLHGMKRKSN